MDGFVPGNEFVEGDVGVGAWVEGCCGGCGGGAGVGGGECPIVGFYNVCYRFVYRGAGLLNNIIRSHGE